MQYVIQSMADSSSRASKNEISALVKEQRQLKNAETKLKSMIDKINGHLNRLVVEELQLKSRELDNQYPSSSGQVGKNSIKTESVLPSDQINQQELNLNIQHTKLMKSLEESEEEDEWYREIRRECIQVIVIWTIKFDSKQTLQ